jgi:hypothetical protein
VSQNNGYGFGTVSESVAIVERSLVAHHFGVVGVAGSNPVAPIGWGIIASKAFGSSRHLLEVDFCCSSNNEDRLFGCDMGLDTTRPMRSPPS